MQLTAADAESDVRRILCAWGRVYACNGELAEADIPDIGIGVNEVTWTKSRMNSSLNPLIGQKVG